MAPAPAAGWMVRPDKQGPYHASDPSPTAGDGVYHKTDYSSLSKAGRPPAPASGMGGAGPIKAAVWAACPSITPRLGPVFDSRNSPGLRKSSAACVPLLRYRPYGPNGFRVSRPAHRVLMYPEKRCKMVLENGRFHTYFAEKELLCTMTETEIRAYMEQMEEEAAAVVAAGQTILDHLAEMAAVLTVGSGSNTAHHAKHRPSAQTVAHSGGIGICG